MTDLSENYVRNYLDLIVSHRRLLDHSYYRKWTMGLLKLDHIRQYAREYFKFVLNEPCFLSAVHSNTPNFPTKDDPCGISVRQRILSNLVGEEQGDENHPELWRKFCLSLGMNDSQLLDEEMLPGTENLISCFSDICKNEPFYNGLSAMYAFESQIPEVSEQKISGLRTFYGLTDPGAYKFFTVHQEADVIHSYEEAKILGEVVNSEEKLSSAGSACQRAADALLGFLDSIDETYCSDVVCV
ncbi:MULTISPECIES: CADD family putative folate metabolism protein [Candidatus Ichthyocystis]|uniref:Putative pyrroloquinoline-quinone synthase n=1 Tax=Candidatus Ichthyocystis hellenicum TaxID=1561003 RepID=A0A0S4M0G8_9BURK|nr:MULTISPECIES: CADD family putative folate metabolism protein [Ichthyocystis]CUT17230.1 putative pyrroloquinoline-quinone synthase [Candidatus Ichthyocystis hellenicum]